MLIFWAILILIFGYLLIDFTIIVYLPKIFGIWPPISELGKKRPLIESYPHWIKTNIKVRFIESMVNNRMGYKTVTLTEDQIFLKNTRLTYLLKIDIPSVRYFEIEKNIFGKYIKLIFSENGDDLFFSFKPNNFTDWLHYFSNLGLIEKT